MLHRKNWVLIGMTLCTASAVMATPVTFIGSDGTMSAGVTFDTSGTNLLVTLTNTSTLDALRPTDILTAMFFQSEITLNLAPVSAVVPAGSTVLFGTTDPGNSVGGEWAYKAGIWGASSYGISSVGLGLFGPHDLFPGSNLQGPDSPDGLQYGITSAGDNPLTGNTPVTGDNALIKNEVVFVLSGLPVGFDPSTSITSVMFQYGTDLTDPHCYGVRTPEPATLGLLAISSLIAFRRRSVGAR